jgi:transposase
MKSRPSHASGSVSARSWGSWLQQAEIDGGERPGTTTGDKRRIAELEREVRELRRANEILKAASIHGDCRCVLLA